MIFVCETSNAVIAKQRVTFFLELNHDTYNLVPKRSLSFCVHRRKPGSVLKTRQSFDSNKHILNQLPIAD